MGCGKWWDPLGINNYMDPISGSASLLGVQLTPVELMTNPWNAGAMIKSDWSAFKHLLVPDMRRDREVQAQSATNARSIVYGRTRVGNQLAYAETTGTKSETLHLICIHAGHEIDGYEEIYFDDKLVCNSSGVAPAGWSGAWVSGAWAIQAPFTGKASIELYDGTQIAACASLVAASAGGWTANHKLLGLAYTHITLTYDEAAFPAGIPTVKAVLRGKKVYDPRTGKTQWSSNPWLCIRDYMLIPEIYGGMGCVPGEINETAGVIAANICDELVYSDVPSDQADGVKTTGVIGSYAASRYTLNGIIKLDGVPTQFIRDMLTSCAGDAVYSGAEWRIHAGSPQASVATIDESWLNGGFSFQTGSNKNDKSNTVKGTFTNSNDYWADTEFPPVPIGASTPPNTSYWSLTISPVKYDAAATYVSGDYVLWASKVYQAYNSVSINSEPPSSGHWVLIEEHDNALPYPSGYVVQRGGVVYTSISTVPVSNPYIAEDDGEVLTANLIMPYTITSPEAQRLAKIALLKSRGGFTMSYPCNHKAFKLDVMDVVTVVNDRLSMSKDFRIVDWSFSFMGGVKLSLAEYNPLVFDWETTESTPYIAPILTNLPDPYTVTSPGSLTVIDAAVTYDGDVTRSETTFSWVSTSALGVSYVIYLDGVEYVTTLNTSYVFRDLLLGAHSFGVKAVSTTGVRSSIASTNHTVITVNGTVSVLDIGAVPTVSLDGLKTLTLNNTGLTGVGPVDLRSSSSATDFNQIIIDSANASLVSTTAGDLSYLNVGAGQFVAVANDALSFSCNLGTVSFVSGGGTSLYLDAAYVSYTLSSFLGSLLHDDTGCYIVAAQTVIGDGTNNTVIDATGNLTAPTIATTVYTVASLPTGAVGMRAFVSDALLPTFLVAVAGGGAVKVPVYHNGTAWIVG